MRCPGAPGSDASERNCHVQVTQHVPGIGAVTLALLFGLFNLIAGISMLVKGIELRRTGRTLHSVKTGTAEKKAA